MESTLGFRETTLDGRLAAFEQAWRFGRAPELADHLSAFGEADERPKAAKANEYSQFIALDIEYRWRSANVQRSGSVPARPRLEYYLARFPELAASDPSVLELAAAEYRARRIWGDNPDRADYLARFPHLADQLLETLAKMDDEIAREREPDPARPLDPPTFPCDVVDDVGPPPIQGLTYNGVVGRGGMGVVYKAFDSKLGREVAVKTTPADVEASSEERRRFHDEAFAVARINHPHILTIHAVGETRGRPFLVIEYLEGGSLSDRLRTGPLPAREAAVLLQTLALAIQEAHDRGIVHRDLKPSNILFTASGIPKICDFGLAKRLEGESARTATGAILGTPSFMAPEQAQGRSREIGPRSDVYSLGAIFYHALTGRPPFLGESPIETLKLVAETDPLTPRRIRPGLARDLDTICLKCLDKNPAKRYATARELADDLGRFLEGKLVRARRLGPIARLAKWTRRHPWQSALAASVFVAGGIVLGLVARHDRLLRAEVHRTEAQAALARLNYDQARETIRAMIKRANNDDMVGTPRLLELRHDLVEQALAFHQTILAQGDSDDPRVMADAASALSEDAVYLSGLGRAREAETYARRAIGLFETLHRRHPGDLESRKAWAECLARLATGLIHDSTPAERIDFGRRAVDLVAALRAQNPEDMSLPELEGMARHDHAMALWGSKRSEEAIAEYESAIAIRSRLDPKSHPNAVHTISGSLTNMGIIYWTTGRLDQAERTLRRAWDSLGAQAEAPAGRTRGLLARWQVALNLSGVLNDLGRPIDSVQLTTEALATLDAYLKQDPNDAECRSISRMLHGNRAIALGRLNRHRESAQDWQRLVSLSDPPVPLAHRIAFAIESLAAGDRPTAEGVADQITFETARSAVDRYNAACVFCLIAQSARDDKALPEAQKARLVAKRLDQAIFWLKAAGELGYFAEAAVRAAARKDADLDLIRDHPDYRALVAEPAAGK